MLAASGCGDSWDVRGFLSENGKTRSATRKAAQAWNSDKKTRVVARLRDELKGPDEGRSRRAASALADLGAEADPAVTDLAELFIRCRRSAACESYALALTRLPSGKSQAPAVFADLPGGRDDRLLRTAIFAVVKLSRGNPEMLEPARLRLKSDPDPNMREAAALALGEIGGRETAGAVPDLIAALDDEAAGVRRASLHSLSATAEAGWPAVKKILTLIDRRPEDRQECFAALDALGATGKADPKKRPVVIPGRELFRLTYKELGRPTKVVRTYAPGMAPDERKPAKILPAPAVVASSSRPAPQSPRRQALAPAPVEDPESLEALRTAAFRSTGTVRLGHVQKLVRLHALHAPEGLIRGALAETTGEGRDELARLVRKTFQTAPAIETRVKFARLLLESAPDDAEVLAWLSEKVPQGEPLAASLLASSAISQTGAQIALECLLAGKGSELGNIYTLGQMGPVAAAAVPELTRRLKSGRPAVRAAAAYALGRIGAAAAPAQGALKRLRGDPSSSVRRHAEAALRGLAPGKPWWQFW